MRLESFDGPALLLALGLLHYTWALYDRRRLRRSLVGVTRRLRVVHEMLTRKAD